MNPNRRAQLISRCKTFRSEVPQSAENPAERGAVIMIVGMILTILMMSAAFAVDFGAWYGRAEQLQNAVDSAALAGAQEYDLRSDEGEARARVLDVLKQNGIVETTDIAVDIAFPGELDLENGEVNVQISDRNVELYFSSFFIDNMEISRDATALLDDCGATCSATLQIPPPFASVTVTGTGDGFIPILIDDRIYGVNHHLTDAEIVCIEMIDSTPCSGYPKDYQPDSSDFNSDQIVLHETVGDRIYIAGQLSGGGLSVGCFDTVAEYACAGSPHIISTLPANGTSAKSMQRGGAISYVDGRLFVFTDDYQVHCLVISGSSWTSNCSGYPQPSGLAHLAGDSSYVPFGPQQDRSIDFEPGNEKIYVNTRFDSPTSVRTHCWSVVSNSPCSGFGPSAGVTSVEIVSGDDTGRSFLWRDAAGNVTGACAMDYGDYNCVNESGAPMTDVGGFILGSQSGSMGTNFWHAGTNRLIFNVGRGSAYSTQCWDFKNNSHCGWIKPSGTSAYGYAGQGNCLFALGHNSNFWTFNPDMTEDCDAGSETTRIFPCQCYNGDKYWGSVTVVSDLDPVNGPFDAFDVYATAPDGTIVKSADLLTTGGVVDLNDISADYPWLDLVISVEAKAGENPWTVVGTYPTLVIGWSDKPHLVR